jgi:hypothetical protein
MIMARGKRVIPKTFVDEDFLDEFSPEMVIMIPRDKNDPLIGSGLREKGEKLPGVLVDLVQRSYSQLEKIAEQDDFILRAQLRE